MANNNKHTGPNVPALRFPEFSGEWEQCQIKDFGKVITGSTPPTSKTEYYDNGEFLWASPADLGNVKDVVSTKTKLSQQGFDKCRKIPAHSILVTCIGSTIGKMGMATTEMATNQQINSIIPIDCSPDYVYYSIQSRFPKYITSIATQAVPILSKSVFESLDSYKTSIEEQNKIGKLLHLLDERIDAQSKIIEEQETLLRSLRHKIYSRVQAQSQCTIADVLCYEQPTKYLVTDTDYTDDDSQVPVLTANKAFILGYTTENFGIYDKGPCIILDDFTLDCKYVDFKFKVKSSAIKILRAKAKTNLRFIFEYFRFLELNTTEHRRHYIAEIEPMSILLPSNEEIDRIACLFTALDERLEVARKELKILESQKMYMLQKMFI